MGLIASADIETAEPTCFDIERQELQRLQAVIMGGNLDPRELALQGAIGALTAKAKLNALIYMLQNDIPVNAESLSAQHAVELRRISASLTDQLTRPVVARTKNIEQALRE